MQRLIGQEVMICATGRRGRISDVDGERITVAIADDEIHFSYPDALVSNLRLRDSKLQEEGVSLGENSSFEIFRSNCSAYYIQCAG